MSRILPFVRRMNSSQIKPTINCSFQYVRGPPDTRDPPRRGFWVLLFYATCTKSVVQQFVTQICLCQKTDHGVYTILETEFLILLNPLKPELNPICYLLALLGAHHFLHVSRIRVKLLTFRLLMSYIYIYIYGAPILDVSRSHTTTQHSR